MSRTTFHRLVVSRVDRLTADSAAVTFAVPDDLRERFAFAPGQSLTIRRGDERRSYSICAPEGQAPRIGVRVVAGGAVSGWLATDVRAGDVIDVQEPSGTFTTDTAHAAVHVLIAAGSGITPVLSIAASVLAGNAASTVTLFYGNRRSDTVMFADEVAELKDAHPERTQLFHVLSREPQEVELLNGRLDAAKLRILLPSVLSAEQPGGMGSVGHWWLCGPLGMVLDAIGVLTEQGVPPGRIHRELFYVEDAPPDEVRHVDAPVGPGVAVTVILDGRRTELTVPNGRTVLEAAQRVRPDLPFACKGGVCGTCRARVVDGEVRMRRNYALEPAEVAAGYVLTCQGLPVSDTLTVDFDS